jgi:hypothetical protein
MKDKASVRDRNSKDHSTTQHTPADQGEEGGSWQFLAVLIVIGIGIVGLILKSTGIF